MNGTGFEKTAAAFQDKIGALADVAGLPVLDVYGMWRQYADECRVSDQSPVLSEFVNWYSDALGGNREALQASVAKLAR